MYTFAEEAEYIRSQYEVYISAKSRKKMVLTSQSDWIPTSFYHLSPSAFTARQRREKSEGQDSRRYPLRFGLTHRSPLC